MASSFGLSSTTSRSLRPPLQAACERNAPCRLLHLVRAPGVSVVAASAAGDVATVSVAVPGKPSAALQPSRPVQGPQLQLAPDVDTQQQHQQQLPAQRQQQQHCSSSHEVVLNSEPFCGQPRDELDIDTAATRAAAFTQHHTSSTSSYTSNGPVAGPSGAADADRQLSLLLSPASEQQLQHDQEQEQQQLQQDIERLLSHGQATTSAAAAEPVGRSSCYSTTRHIQAPGEDLHSIHSNGGSSSSNSSGSSQAGTPSALMQQQQWQQQQVQEQQEQQQRRSVSTSRQGTGVRGLKQQLVRPLEGTGATGARACSPSQLAELSDVLHMPVPALQKLLERHPQLQQPQPAALRAIVQQLSSEFDLSYREAAFMAAKQPQQLLLKPIAQAAAAAAALAEALAVPPAAVAGAAATVPSLLARPLPPLLRRLQSICTWFSVPPRTALAMVAMEPELLTDSGSGLQRRLAALRSVFLLKPSSAQRLAAALPRALFLTPRIMNNKLKVLMAVLHKDRKAVGLIVYKTPQLLRTNLERVRVCYQLLPLLLQRSEGFAYAVVAHNGRLLLLPPPKLLLRGARLGAALLLVPAWQQQWQQLRPPTAEQSFAATLSRFERLEYLAVTQQADSISVQDALCLAPAAFQQQYSTWPAWQRMKQLQLQEQQRRRQQQQQQHTKKHQQQHEQRPKLGADPQQLQQPPLHQSVGSGPASQDSSSSSRSIASKFEPLQLTQQQQQLQLQYQQLVHQQLRQLQAQHKQQQLQYQQYRVHVLQHKALQAQQLLKAGTRMPGARRQQQLLGQQQQHELLQSVQYQQSMQHHVEQQQQQQQQPPQQHMLLEEQLQHPLHHLQQQQQQQQPVMLAAAWQPASSDQLMNSSAVEMHQSSSIPGIPMRLNATVTEAGIQEHIAGSVQPTIAAVAAEASMEQCLQQQRRQAVPVVAMPGIQQAPGLPDSAQGDSHSHACLQHRCKPPPPQQQQQHLQQQEQPQQQQPSPAPRHGRYRRRQQHHQQQPGVIPLWSSAGSSSSSAGNAEVHAANAAWQPAAAHAEVW